MGSLLSPSETGPVACLIWNFDACATLRVAYLDIREIPVILAVLICFRALMTLDGRIVTIPYPGGAISSFGANMKDVFGDNFEGLAIEPNNVAVNVRQHTRTRVIGGQATQVAATNYRLDSWPRQPVDPAAGGTTILITLSDGEDWTFRVSGPFWRLNNFLRDNMTADAIFYRTERGTKYTVSKGD